MATLDAAAANQTRELGAQSLFELAAASKITLAHQPKALFTSKLVLFHSI
jgi:hypothetical protein